jgi:predicted transcriptional regulator
MNRYQDLVESDQNGSTDRFHRYKQIQDINPISTCRQLLKRIELILLHGYSGFYNMNARSAIDTTKIKDAICMALADRYSKVILMCIIDEPKSAIEIGTESKIPMSTAYRSMHYLNKAGLIHVNKTITTDDGKKYCLYKSNVKAVNTVFGINSISVEIIINDDMGKSNYW